MENSFIYKCFAVVIICLSVTHAQLWRQEKHIPPTPSGTVDFPIEQIARSEIREPLFQSQPGKHAWRSVRFHYGFRTTVPAWLWMQGLHHDEQPKRNPKDEPHRHIEHLIFLHKTNYGFCLRCMLGKNNILSPSWSSCVLGVHAQLRITLRMCAWAVSPKAECP